MENGHPTSLAMELELLASLPDFPISDSLTSTGMDCPNTNNSQMSAPNSGTMENRIKALFKNIGASADELALGVISVVDDDWALRLKEVKMNTDVVNPEVMKALTKKQKESVRSGRNQKVARQKPKILRALFSQAVTLLAHEYRNVQVENSKLTHDNESFANEYRILFAKYQDLVAQMRELKRQLKDSYGPGPGPDNPPSGSSTKNDDGQDENGDSDSGGSGRSFPSSAGGTAFTTGSSSNGNFPSDSMLNTQLCTGTFENYYASSLDESSYSEQSGIDEESLVEFDSSTIATERPFAEYSSDGDKRIRKIDEPILTEDRIPDTRNMNEEGGQKFVRRCAISAILESSAEYVTGKPAPYININAQKLRKREFKRRVKELSEPAPASGPDNPPSGSSTKNNDGPHGKDGPWYSGSSNGKSTSESMRNPQLPTSTPENYFDFSPDVSSNSEQTNVDEESLIDLDSSLVATEHRSVEYSNDDENRVEKIDETLVTKRKMPDLRNLNDGGGQKLIASSKLEDSAECGTRTSAPQINLNAEEPCEVEKPSQYIPQPKFEAPAKKVSLEALDKELEPNNPSSSGSTKNHDGLDSNNDSYSGGSGCRTPRSTNETALYTSSSSNAKSTSESRVNAQLPTGTPEYYSASLPDESSYSEQSSIHEAHLLEQLSTEESNRERLKMKLEMRLMARRSKREDVSKHPRSSADANSKRGGKHKSNVLPGTGGNFSSMTAEHLGLGSIAVKPASPRKHEARTVRSRRSEKVTSLALEKSTDKAPATVCIDFLDFRL